MLRLLLVLHDHQPVGNFGFVFDETWGQAYEPMRAALERHPGVRLGLHYTGPLLDWFKRDKPEAIERLRGLTSPTRRKPWSSSPSLPTIACSPSSSSVCSPASCCTSSFSIQTCLQPSS